jgi:hypothetical protein
MARDLVVVDVASPPPTSSSASPIHRITAAPVVEDGRLVGCDHPQGRARSTLYRPNCDATGHLRVGVAIGINGHPAVKAKAVLDLGVDLLVIDTAHGHQTRTLRAIEEVRAVVDQTVGAGRSAGPHRGRQRGDRAGDARPHRGRCGHRQGRRRAGRHVHDTDDDGRGASAVLGRPRVLDRGPPPRPPRLGRTAESATPATSPWPWPPARRA